MSITGQPSGQLAAVVRAADRIDYWIRRHATEPPFCNRAGPNLKGLEHAAIGGPSNERDLPQFQR
jgi:hypothetical protein